MPYTYEHPRPAITVDVVLFALQNSRLRVLLIRRKAPPFQDRWALPGGFLNIDEELEAAARRELREETGLEIDKMLELGAFGKLGRDPRGRTVSIAYLAVHCGEPPPARAGDDASEASWFSATRPPALAFDHRKILRVALERLQALAEDPLKLAQRLLPCEVTLDQLHVLFQALGGQAPERAALRRKLKRLWLV